MGQLKEGATYIYERHNGITYAREAESDPSTRFAIGWDAETQHNELELLGNIWIAAKSNQALQSALDNVIMLYHLSKEEDGKST